MKSQSFGQVLGAVALVVAGFGCTQHASPSAASAIGGPRLGNPDAIIVVPANASWVQPANSEFPHYPSGPRNAGVEGRAIASFVVNEQGQVELPTVSFIDVGVDLEFHDAVCDFMRRAAFQWRGHAPIRGLVVMSFDFTLSNVRVTKPLPPSPNLSRITDQIATYSPHQLVDWIEAKPHCP